MPSSLLWPQRLGGDADEIVIGLDVHKQSETAVALDGLVSARAVRRRDGELAADRSCSADRDLAVAWDRRAPIERGIAPDRVAGTLADQFAAVVEKMSFELLALHAAARSIVTCSACPPPIGGSLPSSR